MADRPKRGQPPERMAEVRRLGAEARQRKLAQATPSTYQLALSHRNAKLVVPASALQDFQRPKLPL
eukprot:1861851-Pyramimonas_sp.AAC.1